MRQITRELWERLEVVLDNVLELPADTCKAYLDVACESDPELREQVERFRGLSLRLFDQVEVGGAGAGAGVAIDADSALAEQVVTSLFRESGCVDPALRSRLEPALHRIGSLDARLAKAAELRLIAGLAAGDAARVLDENETEFESNLRKALLLLFALEEGVA